MEEILSNLTGKKIDVACTTSSAFTGEAVDVSGGVLSIRDEDDKLIYVAVDKITFVRESHQQNTRPGFIV